MAVLVQVRGSDPPGLTCGPSRDRPDGYRDIHVGLQCGQQVVDRSPGDRPFVADISIEVRGGRLVGPFVHGRNGERFLYLSWGEAAGEEFRMFRRAKIQLEHLNALDLDGTTVTVTLSLQDTKGHPVCASLRPPDANWSAVDE